MRRIDRLIRKARKNLEDVDQKFRNEITDLKKRTASAEEISRCESEWSTEQLLAKQGLDMIQTAKLLRQAKGLLGRHDNRSAADSRTSFAGARNVGFSAQNELDLFSILRNVLLLVSVYLYWMGWNYAYYFFYYFGLSLHVVQIPFYFYIVYSYSVLTSTKAVIWGIAFLMLLLVSQLLPSHWTKPRLAMVLLTVCIGVGLFPFFRNVAQRTAREEFQRRRSGYAKTVTFVLKPGTQKTYPRSFLCQNKYQHLKLLAQTPTNYYVFYQPPGGEEEELPFATTYDILRSDILLAQIEMQNIPRKGD